MSTFREIDMSIHSLLDRKPIQKIETTAEEIPKKYKQSEAEQADSKGKFRLARVTGFILQSTTVNSSPT